MSKKIKQSKLVSMVSALLMLVAIVVQFIPFWNVEGKSLSINAYIWWYSEHMDVQKYFQGLLGDAYVVNGLVLYPIAILILGAVAIAFTVLRKTGTYTTVAAILCGLAGILQYLTQPVYRLGNLWVVYLILHVVLFAISLVPVITAIRDIRIAAKELKADAEAEAEAIAKAQS